MEKIFGTIEVEAIERLADLVSSKDLGGITIETGDCRITVKGKKSIAAPPMPVPMPMQAAPDMRLPVQETSAPAKETLPQGNVVKSPIVGTFYQSPSPDKPPFVKVGDTVKKGDVIMIIESMKLMNEVQSEFDGVVEKVLVSNGQAVEFDQPIMIIK